MVKVIFTLTAAVSSVLGAVCYQTDLAPGPARCKKEIRHRLNVDELARQYIRTEKEQANINQKMQSPS